LLSRKPLLLFKSFTGLTLSEFNNIYEKITKRYDKHEIQRLSSKRKDRERDISTCIPFNIDIKNRSLILLVYYRLYITSI
jgi:hypothetical protein